MEYKFKELEKILLFDEFEKSNIDQILKSTKSNELINITQLWIILRDNERIKMLLKELETHRIIKKIYYIECINCKSLITKYLDKSDLLMLSHISNSNDKNTLDFCMAYDTKISKKCKCGIVPNWLKYKEKYLKEGYILCSP